MGNGESGPGFGLRRNCGRLNMSDGQLWFVMLLWRYSPSLDMNNGQSWLWRLVGEDSGRLNMDY